MEKSDYVCPTENVYLMKYAIIFVSILLMMSSCKDAGPKYPKLDLMKYGFPVEINAPEGAIVEKGDLGIMQDVTIKSGDEYYVQIFGSDATTIDVSSIKAGQLAEVKASRFFSKIVEEHDAGFIYEKKIDDRINYDFRYTKILADKEYVYQTGLVGTYTEQQVRDMYESVQ